MPNPIIDIKQFREALKAITFDALVVLDLDNTVMTPRTAFGGEAWFNGLFGHLSNNNDLSSDGREVVLSIYNAAQNFVRTSAVETKTGIIIKALQDIGIPLIGLTARGYSIREQTLRQLSEISVNFSTNSILPDDDSSCQGGIIFCDGGDKGKILTSVLSRLNFTPSRLVMLDDKQKHLERVMNALKPLNIHFSGFRYGYLDEVIQQFSMDRANVELAYLWNYLSPTVQKHVKDLKLPIHTPNPSPPPKLSDFFYPEPPLQSHDQSDTMKRSPGRHSLFYVPDKEQPDSKKPMPAMQ